MLHCFADKVGEVGNNYFIYKGSINERLVLVKESDDQQYNTPNESVRDIAVTSQMSQLKTVLKLSGCCLEFIYPSLVYEYVEFETLHNLLHDNEKLLPWKKRMKVALDIASAILYVHTSFQTPIIHRDLKPCNVIIDEHGVAKLLNFSLSISLPRGELQVQNPVRGTIVFLDPEYLNSRFVTQKSDVYSFGVILLELVTVLKSFCAEREIPYVVDYVNYNMENNRLSEIRDPKLVRQGFDHQQLRAILDLGLKCTKKSGEDRSEMIDVARELRQIQKSVSS